jgi:hypothetical protein
MTVQVLSRWLNQQPIPLPMTDAERHDVFATYAVNVANGQLPWLLPLLNEASATLYVGPSMFFFQLPSHPGKWHEVPEMARLIPMVPWVEQEETPQ